MVNFNFSLHKATHIEHRHFWLPVATAGRGFCRGKRTAIQAANDRGTVVVSRPCGMPKQTVTTRVKSTKLTDQHRWVEILFRFLPAVFLPVVRWPVCFVEFFCLLALDCIVPWEFEILYRAELSNPARNCHIFNFQDFLLLTFDLLWGAGRGVEGVLHLVSRMITHDLVHCPQFSMFVLFTSFLGFLGAFGSTVLFGIRNLALDFAGGNSYPGDHFEVLAVT